MFSAQQVYHISSAFIFFYHDEHLAIAIPSQLEVKSTVSTLTITMIQEKFYFTLEIVSSLKAN